MDPSSAATANTDRDLRSCNGGAARGTLVIFIKVCLYDGPFMWSSCHLHCFSAIYLSFRSEPIRHGGSRGRLVGGIADNEVELPLRLSHLAWGLALVNPSPHSPEPLSPSARASSVNPRDPPDKFLLFRLVSPRERYPFLL